MMVETQSLGADGCESLRAGCARGKGGSECAHSRQMNSVQTRKVVFGKLRADDEGRKEDIPLKWE